MKNKEFLFCVDSDGCVIDGMTIKHLECFGPCLIEEWGLESDQEDILNYWNKLNLYSMTRGINRFKGLLITLEYINNKGFLDIDTKVLREWVETTKELSNSSLKNAIEINDDEVLKKSLSWSEKVNVKVNALPESKKKPFWGVEEILKKISGFADIAVVSSANLKAVEDEWGDNNLLKYVTYVMTQEKGSKSECIKKLLELGYTKEKTIMVGDAPGDIQAAKDASVLYYPIIPEKEIGSWNRMERVVFGKFLKGNYSVELINKYEEEFNDSLKN